MKPPGIDFGLNDHAVILRVTKPTRIQDAIYLAVEEAREAGWTPKQFIKEFIECWEIWSREQSERERKELQAISASARNLPS